MPAPRLSILIAVYNEANSLDAVLARVSAALQELPFASEIIAVDNASTDSSFDILERFRLAHPNVALSILRRTKNLGKGAAIRMALAQAQGEFCLIQDADLEYDPADYARMLAPLLQDDADFVLGSRFLLRDGVHRPLGFWQAAANRLLSTLAGLAAGLEISDVENAYKAFRTSIAQSIPLRSDRFGLDPELVVQFAKRNARFVEAPVRYRGRTPEQGKKIRAWDTLDAVATILAAWWLWPAYKDPGAQILAVMSRAKRFNRWMADTIAPFVQGDVLEIGAGIGNMTLLFADRAQGRYLATDSDQSHLSELRSKLEYRPTVDTAQLDLADSAAIEPFAHTADTLVCINVLEHIADDEEALRHSKRCLRANGVAIVLVPQGPELFGKLDQVLEHKRRYTKDDLTRKMTAAGFQVSRVIEFNRATRPGWYLNSKLLRRETMSRAQLQIFDWLVPLWRRIDRNLPWPSNSLIAVGEVVDE